MAMSPQEVGQWVEENEIIVADEPPTTDCTRVWSPTVSQCPTELHPTLKLAAVSTGRFLSTLVIWAAAGVVAVAGQLEKKVTAYIDEATDEELPVTMTRPAPTFERVQAPRPGAEDPLWRRALRRKAQEMIESGFNWLKPESKRGQDRIRGEQAFMRPETDNDFEDFEEEDRLCNLRPPSPRDLIGDRPLRGSQSASSEEMLTVRAKMPPAWLEKQAYSTSQERC